ncbi:hypothetical protein FRC12_001227 [Ceratobasidium sp. 428]|nr:hypothetical protein FRC09_000662 [Ceratobasidium sp. 395]KAG8775868.1 hypothetical protein FRC12_001227 [Ceratobasidium sp. 428]
MPYNKEKDVYRYIRAEEFFGDLDSDAGSHDYTRIENVQLLEEQSDEEKSITHHGKAFRDDNGKIFILEFIRPTVFRLRFNPNYTTLTEYVDNNSRNLVQRSLTDLINTLDKFEGINWKVVTEETSEYVKLESRPTLQSNPNGHQYMCIYIRKKRFRIVAIKSLKRRVCSGTKYINQVFGVSALTAPGNDTKIVWATKPKGVLYSGKTVVVEVEKPGMARYLGFGEQGGHQLLKTKLIADYFNYDNMTYSQVYGQGPLDSREPLYHSEPFWMEVAQHPGHLLKVATFVDNFSQVCLDIGSKHSSMVRVVTRFNSMQLCVVSSDSISGLINSYTSIVGRPRLKPRYVLGYHQGCYGYDHSDKIRNVVDGYRNADFPLDGIHIDVDFQRNYKTFTVDESSFSSPQDFFSELKDQGIKCSTNITPFINGDEDPYYSTLQEGLRKGYFVKDKRYIGEGGPTCANEDRYMLYRGGHMNEFQASDLSQEPRIHYQPPDHVELSTTWNTEAPFRGGVWYGEDLGKPGYYPDLNREEVRDWWGKQYDHLIKLGLEFVWQDMTSPCMGASYGDMRSFPFRLLLPMDAVKDAQKTRLPVEAPAIEVWALYAFNLHKATSKGWDNSPNRKDPKTGKYKRNFIIGRGGFIGLHRFAGLWTGDNSSKWDFLKVSVAQVMSLGLSGVTIAGGDVGGFEQGCDGEQWASPELVMRWYCAYSLLPWFRNHYNGKRGKKLFQEPYRFIEHINKVPDDQKWMYRATLPVCRYYVRLRYTFLQLLYDQMFDNLLTGLPIARSLIISNEDDLSLVTENADYLDDEYMVGDDLLVAPILWPQADRGNVTRTVYLPRPASWWQCNLRADGPDAAIPLGMKFRGGSLIPYDARMSDQEHQIPWITPTYIRYGAIIPQVEPRSYAEDISKPNPISLHIYPGHNGPNRTYDMYLDDGVSRESAPTAAGLQKSLAMNKLRTDPSLFEGTKVLQADAFGDDKAQDVYWKIRFEQKTRHVDPTIVRTVTVKTVHQHPGFDPTTVHGSMYRLVVWAKPKRKFAFSQANVRVFTSKGDVPVKNWCDSGKNAWIVELSIQDVARADYTVELTYKA